MRLKVSWQLLSEYGSFFSHSLPAIYKNHNKECLLTKLRISISVFLEKFEVSVYQQYVSKQVKVIFF